MGGKRGIKGIKKEKRESRQNKSEKEEENALGKERERRQKDRKREREEKGERKKKGKREKQWEKKWEDGGLGVKPVMRKRYETSVKHIKITREITKQLEEETTFLYKGRAK